MEIREVKIGNSLIRIHEDEIIRDEKQRKTVIGQIAKMAAAYMEKKSNTEDGAR